MNSQTRTSQNAFITDTIGQRIGLSPDFLSRIINTIGGQNRANIILGHIESHSAFVDRAIRSNDVVVRLTCVAS
jgi:hypothetical protein